MPRPKGTGALSIRIEAGDETHRPRIFIGRALWQALGSPARLTIKRDMAGNLVFRPASATTGYAVTASGNSIPRLTIGTPLFDALQLTDGDYPAEIADGAIIARVT